jgi:hypothetical protein
VSRKILREIPLHLTGKGIIFFMTIILCSCNATHKDDDPKRISIIWKNNRATGIAIPKSSLDNITDDSIHVQLQVRLSKNGGENAIGGDYMIKTNEVIFEPFIPFTRGLQYAIYIQHKLYGKVDIPKDSTLPRLIALYPRGDSLPENLLKIYFEFSQPMVEGHAQEYIHLLDNKGDSLSDSFLFLQSELWNEEGTILSLWLDPGRIKRDLQPNKRFGPPLIYKSHYQLVIDSAWPDKQGTILGRSFIKKFVASARDTVSPDPAHWKLIIPQKETRQPFIADTGESLDYFLLLNTITFLDPSGKEITGETVILNGDQGFSFIPDTPWFQGVYTMQIESRLADLAGNNLNRPFDLDLKNTAGVKPAKDLFTRKWKIN